MTAPMFFISSMSTLDDVISSANMRQDLIVLECRMSCERGGMWRASLKIANPGLALFSTSQPLFYAIIYCPDGTWGSANVLFKGRISGKISNLTNQTCTIELLASAANIKNLLWTYINSNNLLSLPNFDEAMDDLSFDRPGDALKAIGSTFYVDPVTHAISVNPLLEPGSGGSNINLGSSYIWNSFKLEEASLPPVQSVRMTVQAEWQQTAIGLVDISSIVNGTNFPAYGITTVTSDFADYSDKNIPGKYLNFTAGQGWTKDQNSMLMSVSYFPMLTGRVWQYNFSYVEQTNTSNPEYGVDPVTGDIVITGYQEYSGYTTSSYPVTYNEVGVFQVFNWYFYELFYRYDYVQQRRETLTIQYDYQIQAVAGSITQLDIGTATMRDLTTMYYANPTPAPEPDAFGNYYAQWTPYIKVANFNALTIYPPGSYVNFGGGIYQCIATSSIQGYFWEYGVIQSNGVVFWGNDQLTFDAAGNSHIQYPAGITTPSWQYVASTAPLSTPDQSTYFDTARGGQSIQHALLRCRAAARLRSEMFTVSFETNFDNGLSITPLDTLTISVPSSTYGQSYTLTGKVTKVERSITKRGLVVSVEMKISVGTGANVSPPTFSVGDMTPALDTWFAQNTTPTSNFDNWTGTWTSTYLGLYNFTQYYTEANLLGSYAFNDILYVVAAQPVVEYIDATQLSNPSYAVTGVQFYNQASAQLAAAQEYVQRGIDPRDAIRDNPTYVNITMRSLVSEGVLERLYDCAASSTISTQGINLTSGVGP